ncbi:13046_t:CDS:2 [Cetraspora pellucida]|uniref:13046_t:CDS:1 n=1 Tax=Cetraspora pellucida TaxID=1433469 RepID=A0A9N9HY02_9GLOM|nr:13046_t:CDS:2 [Cetraspora pellucida]
MVKVAILGCGNIGFFLAAKILHHYHPVSNKKTNVNEKVELLLVGRQRLLDDLNVSERILLTTLDGSKIVIPKDHVNYVTDAKKLIEFQPDYVLVTLKIVSIQNGVRNYDLIQKNFPNSQVIGGMIVQNINYTSHCNFTQSSDGVIFIQSTPSTHSLSSILSNSGVNLIITSNIKSVQYGKLLLNLGNAITALSGSAELVLKSETYRRILAMCQWEAMEMLDYSEIPFTSFNRLMPIRFMPYVLYAPDLLADFFITKVLKMDVKTMTPSMLQDFRSGRKTEIVELQGEIVRLGEIIRNDINDSAIIMDGVKAGGCDHSLTPYNDGILELVELVEEWMDVHKEGWKVCIAADENGYTNTSPY